jgi:integrase
MDGGIAARGTNKLTELEVKAHIRKRRAGEATAMKLFDGGGLFLTVTAAGTAVWRVKYRLGGKESTISIGSFPEVGIKGARVEREAVKNLLRQGRDPVQERRLNRAAAVVSSGNTFAAVAQDWLERKRQGWSEVHYRTTKQAIERDVLPHLGALPVADITPAMVVKAIEEIFKPPREAIDTAGKVMWNVESIFRLAQARGLCRDNPATPVREVLPRKKRPGRRPAFLEWPQLGDVLRRANVARLSPAVRMAHRLCAFTAARIGNVIQAEWSEFDLDTEVPLWVIPRAKMKAQDRHHDHKVILGPSIATELRTWRLLSGSKGHLFPSVSGEGQHITHESIEKAYRVTLGLKDKHSPHGWRAAFSTLARDGGFERDVVELALDHIHDNDVVRAYDRGERLDGRIRLSTWWCDQLMRAERGDK